jgi:hypothetical protein
MERWGLISSSFCCSHSVAAGGETYRTASLVDSSESKMVKKKPDIIVQEETFSRHHQDFGKQRWSRQTLLFILLTLSFSS